MEKIILMKKSNNILPIVGIVVTISPNFNLYRMVVFPAASSPTENKQYLIIHLFLYMLNIPIFIT